MTDKIWDWPLQIMYTYTIYNQEHGRETYTISLLYSHHCVKSVQIRSFFWPVFFLYSNSVNLRIQSENRKIRNRKNSVLGQFLRSVCYHLYYLPPIFLLQLLFSKFVVGSSKLQNISRGVNNRPRKWLLSPLKYSVSKRNIKLWQINNDLNNTVKVIS